MPVTIKPWPELIGQNEDDTVNSHGDLLRATYRKCAPKLLPGSNSFSPIIPYGNGFVQGVYRAFQQDLHLVIRPDDVWLAIITQFSQFVKGNSGALRDHFVDHKGQKALEIDVRPASIWSVTMGQLAYAMTSLMQQNLRDPELRDWILPAFSTTTEHDTSVASMVVMAALQNYFSFNLSGGCGFPSVTLEGEKADWEKILSRVKQLPKYGEQTMEWTVLLVPILKKFISSFDPLDSYEKEQLNEFWLRACHATGQDSSGDVETLSGWLTAFCFWDEKGYRISNHADTVNGADRNRLVLNNIAYPIIRTMNIPGAIMTVPCHHQRLCHHEEALNYHRRWFHGHDFVQQEYYGSATFWLVLA